MDEKLKELIEEAVNKAFTIFLTKKESCECSKCKKPDNGKLLTVPEACKELQCSRSTLSRWSKNGYLPITKIGGMVRYRESDIINRKEGA